MQSWWVWRDLEKLVNHEVILFTKSYWMDVIADKNKLRED